MKEKSKKYLKTKNSCVKNGLTCLNCGSTQLILYLPKKKTTVDIDIFPLNSGKLMGAKILPILICMSIAINLVFYKILLHLIRYKIVKYSNLYIKSLDETSYCTVTC